jgi:ADP-heptose:LPS heptosyltransferase
VPALLSTDACDEPGSLPAVPDALFQRRVVCIHAGAGNTMKLWPAAYFAELIDLLVARDGVNVALIGGAADQETVAAVFDKVQQPERVFSLVGSLRLHELPRFIGACALFVGNDSGPKHIAAGIGAPTLAIHSGQVDAHEWGPLGPRAMSVRRKTSCSPCYLSKLEDCERNLACLVELRPRDIYPLCRRLLAIGYGVGLGVSGHLP